MKNLVKFNFRTPLPVISILVFIAGVITGILLLQLQYLTLKDEVTIGEISNFIISIVIALFIPFYLNKKIDSKRIEKSILIEGFEQLSLEIKGLKQLIDTEFIHQKKISDENVNYIIIKSRTISKMLYVLIGNLEDYSNEEKLISNVLKEMKSNQINFWRDLTKNFKNKSNKITPEIYQKTEKNYLIYVTNIIKLKKYINNH